MAKITDLPATLALTGAEHLPVVQGGATKRVTMAAFRDLITPFLQYWYKGDTGDTGPANSTFKTKAALKAAQPTNASYIFAPARGADDGLYAGTFLFQEGDFSGQTYADDFAKGYLVKLTGVPMTQGALARQGADSFAFRHGADGAVNLSQSQVNEETISVRRFGAFGNGLINDTPAIILADRAAALTAKTLFFPSGTYMIDPVRATTGWRGEAGTRFKYRGVATSFVTLIEASGVDGVTFENFIVDGSVSADPAKWDSTNYDSWSGSAGLSVSNCRFSRIIGIRARDTRQHGVRLVNADYAVVRECDTRRSRGQFGDGFLFISCIGLDVQSCRAEDYTRIGFVVDSFGDAVITCHKITMHGNLARNGHDGSISYGGTEFNSGFWLEHVGDVSFSNNFADNNRHRGANICTGSRSNGFPGLRAVISIDNCQMVGGDYGICTYSMGDLPVTVHVTNSSSKGAIRAFESTANNASDSFSYVNCYGEYNAGLSNGAAFAFEVPNALNGRPTFSYTKCRFARTNENLAFLNATNDSAATADIGSFFFVRSAFRLVVDDVTHDLGGPAYINYFGPYAHEVEIRNCKWSMRRGGTTNGSIDVIGGTIYSMVTEMGGSSAAVSIRDTTVVGPVQSTADRYDFVNNSVRLTDASKVHLMSNRRGKALAVRVKDNRWEKNIARDGPCLRLGFGSIDFTTVLTGNDFYNVEGAKTSNAWVESAAGGTRRWSGNFGDDTVDHITVLDTGGGQENELPGFAKVTMH